MKKVEFDLFVKPSLYSIRTPSILWEGYELPFDFPGGPFVVARAPVRDGTGGYVCGGSWVVCYRDHGISVSRSRASTRAEAIELGVALLCRRTEEETRAILEDAVVRRNTKWLQLQVTE